MDDVSFIEQTIAEIGSYVEQPVTLFSFVSEGTSGTSFEAGDPQDVTWGTRTTMARVNHVSMEEVDTSGAIYQTNDQKVSMQGSFSNSDSIVWNAGTYGVIDGPWTFFLGSNLYYQGVMRRVNS